MPVNKVTINTENGEKVLIDLSGDSVAPETLAKGATAHDASGNAINGLVDILGTVDASKNIILSGGLADGIYTIKYEDGAGKRVDVGILSLISYINQVPISTDKDGSIYNGTGYKASMRGNSSGEVVALTSGTNPTFVTGFIPCKQGDVIRFKNCFMIGHSNGNNVDVYGNDLWGLRSGVYNASKAKVDVFSWGFFHDGNTSVVSNYTVGADYKVNQFTIAKSGVSYIRLCLAADKANGFTPADAIVTVNQEIE